MELTQDRIRRRSALLVFFVSAAGPLFGQSGSLALSSAVTVPGVAVSLNLAFTAAPGNPPAALQWTLAYSATEVSSLSVTAGPALMNAGKSLSCAAGAGSLVCVASGINSNIISDGVVAVATILLQPSVTGSTLGIGDAIGAAIDGSALLIGGAGGVITQQPLLTPISLNCTPTTINTPGSTSCVVAFSAAAAGSTTVSLASNNANLSVPPTLTVAAGAASASFMAAAALVAGNQGATVTAALNGTSRTVSLNLASPPPVISSLACSPTALSSGASAVCMVSLDKAANSAGAAVSLASSNPVLSLPPSVLVAAGSASASFAATAAAISSDQAATVTAALNGASRTASLTLTAPLPTVSSLACSPAALSSGASAACTVGLDKPAGSAGAAVSLASSNPVLSLPPSVLVAAGSASASFAATAAAISSDQAATVTAALNGASRTASLTLTAPLPTITSLICSPAALSSGASGSCTVLLSHAAGSAGAALSLASSNPIVPVPAIVSISAGSTSGTFSLTAGSVGVEGTAVITATLNGSQKSSSLSLIAPPALVSLNCAPPGLASGESGTCTLTLSKPAVAGGAVIALSASGSLNVPASTTIPAGDSSTSFGVSAGTIAAEGTGAVTAGMNGVHKTASIALLVHLPALSSISCARTALPPGGATTCTVTLSKAAGKIDVTLSTSSSGVAAPASVSVPAGSLTGSFSIQAGSAFTGWAMLNAQLGTMKKSLILAVRTGVTVSSVSCASPNLIGSSSGSCEIELAEAAAAGGAKVRLSASSARLQVPPEVEVPEGQRLARFTVRGTVSDRSEEASISAAHSGDFESTQISLVGIQPLALACSPRAAKAGDVVSCELHLNSAEIPDSLGVAIASTSEAVAVPASVRTRPRQSTLRFRAVVRAAAREESAIIAATFGEHVVQDAILVTPVDAPVLELPGPQAAAAGRSVGFTVSAVSRNDQPVRLSGSNLPEGASFDPQSGRFEWVPAAGSEGSYALRFTATAAAASAYGEVMVEVDSGKPVVAALRNAASGSMEWACSPGSIAALTGRWLAAAAAEDRSGTTLELAGTRVSVNDEWVPVLQTAADRVEFLCPHLPADSPLTVRLHNEFGAAEPVRTSMRHAAPGVYAPDGFRSGRDAMTFSGSSMPAPLTFRRPGQAVQPADSVTIRATGLASPDSPVLVLLGGIPVTPTDIAPVAAGLYAIRMQVPEGVPFGEDVPLSLRLSHPGAAPLTSNTVTIAIEPRRP